MRFLLQVKYVYSWMDAIETILLIYLHRATEYPGMEIFTCTRNLQEEVTNTAVQRQECKVNNQYYWFYWNMIS